MAQSAHKSAQSQLGLDTHCKSLQKRSKLKKLFCVIPRNLVERDKTADKIKYSTIGLQQTPSRENEVANRRASRKLNASDESFPGSPYIDCETFFDEFRVSQTHKETKLAYYYRDGTHSQWSSVSMTRMVVLQYIKHRIAKVHWPIYQEDINCHRMRGSKERDISVKHHHFQTKTLFIFPSFIYTELKVR